ncbi:MAG: type I pullulanase [Sarcina sp.]
MISSKGIKKIDELYYYDEDDLGLTIRENNFTFKFWSPIADRGFIRIYDHYDLVEFKQYEMQKDKGIFYISLNENIKNKFYTFMACINGNDNEFVDTYAKFVCINGTRGAILDIKDTNPKGFENHKMIDYIKPSESVICEINIRDISIDKSSGLEHKGKFLALKENQDLDFEDLTGMEYIKKIGFTHIQIMPFFDFASIDEKLATNNEFENNRPYNWGYDPKNYNSVEGSYSTNPYDPLCRIIELKEMIQNVHNLGIGVIMDVVYNHIYDYNTSGFHLSMPGYFFRYKNNEIQNESGCGNVFASENKMARKFIVDSVKFWAKEYKLDGFRFDLMGLIDIDTMNEIKRELKKINLNMIIVGEGWNMDSILSEDSRAIQKNAKNLREIAFFNDNMRDALKGSSFIEKDKGFINGDFTKKLNVQKGIVGGIYYNDEINLWGDVFSNQVINYIECHDNYTLYDKLLENGTSLDVIKDIQKLGLSIIILSRGIPFLQLGVEFLRTKHGVDNSYKSPDSTNKIDWNLKKQNIDLVIYIKGLIKLKKTYEAFSIDKISQIRENIKFFNTIESCIAYTLEYKDEKFLIVYNANKYDYYLNLNEEAKLEVLVNKYISGISCIETTKTKNIRVKRLSTFVAKII